MNDVGGSDSGTGLRAGKSSRTSDANFEYDDSEWDVGIGNLIIDLDADIEKNNEANRNSSSANNTLNSSSVSSNSSANNSNSPGNSSLPSGSSTSSQMHIPHSSGTSSGAASSNNCSTNNNNSSSTGKGKSSTSTLPSGGKVTGLVAATNPTSSDLSGNMEHSAIVDKGLKMKIKRTKTGTKSGADAKHEIVKSDLVTASSTTSSPSQGSSSNSNSSSGSTKSGTGGSTDLISSKSAHSSSSHKEKDKIKDSNMIMIDAERDSAVVNSNHNTTGSNANNGIKDVGNTDLGGKGKTPRKGSTHKKVKSGNGSGGSKKDERNSNQTSLDTKGNSVTSGTGGNGNHTKDGKDFFTTTVSLNVPTIVPNSGSSTFVKTTLKVPTATPSSITVNSQNSLQKIHSSAEPVSVTKSHGLPSLTNTSSPWTSGSPSKIGDKTPVSNVSSICLPVEKAQGNSSPSYGKKARAFSAAKEVVSSQQDVLTDVVVGNISTSANSSYRSACLSDLSSSSGVSSISASVNHQGVPNAKSGRATQDVCVGTSVGTVTEPDCLGPCEPGTSVTLEGIVWHETESGVLVVNVTWRGKTYVGTLLDCTKNDWAPPRFCDSPTSDLEMRTPKNRGKRGRGQAPTPVSEVQSDLRIGNTKLRNGAKGRRGSASNAASSFVAPASPMKGEQWPKRKTRGSENESQDEPPPKNVKRPKISKEDRKERQSNSPVPGQDSDKTAGCPTSPVLIECPEPNCSKKYKHINGLRYHQSHAHCNNFVVEDSDSNTSTTSTQLTTPTEVAVNEHLCEPMVLDSLCDIEGVEVSSVGTVEESTLPLKRSMTANGSISVSIKPDETLFDGHVDSELNSKDISELLDSPLSLSCKNSNKNSKSLKEISPIDKEADAKSIVDSINKDSVSSPIVSRAPILTVPVPYISLQNRPVVHGHIVNVPRADAHGCRDQDNVVMKPTVGTVKTSLLASKGIPWQPHAHTNQNHAGNLISSIHSLQNAAATLNIPLSNIEKTSNKDNKDKNSSAELHGKKNKHKKKNKDKDKDGKSKSTELRSEGVKIHGSSSSSSSSSRKEGIRIAGSIFSLSASDSAEGRVSDSADDLRLSKRDDGMHIKNDSSGINNPGDSRDDPQSPAYSDISDANDSGDTEINVGVVKEGCKNLTAPTDLKKDTQGVPVGHNISPFYPTFYSPYLDSNHSSKLGDKQTTPEESDKIKTVKPIPQTHIQGPPPGNLPPSTNQPNTDDTRRSPKMDFHHPKYLPQQHFFHYPYSNYHFDQGQFNNMMPENSFNSARAFAPVEEREKEREIVGDLGKGKLIEKDVSIGISIKQEPGERLKDSRIPPMSKSHQEEKQVEIKSEYGSDFAEPKSIPHFINNATCSKHSKDPKRDDINKGDSSRGSQCDKSLSKENSSGDTEKDLKDRDREREKNEGSKPTMETQGPPPPPTAGSYAYIPQPYLQAGNPFGLHFDPGHPLYRQVLVPGPYQSPYMHPGPIPRFQPPPGGTPLPEDLSRPNTAATGPASKALDLLQHHAAQYYQVHKIHELSERALKSPNPQVVQRDREPPTGPSPSNTPSSPAGLNVPNTNIRNTGSSIGSVSGCASKPADLSKDSKIGPGGPINESSRSPPTHHQHVHSHTHHHTHVGIGYPIIPAFPAPHSPHYGVAASVIPPLPSQKPN